MSKKRKGALQAILACAISASPVFDPDQPARQETTGGYSSVSSVPLDPFERGAFKIHLPTPDTSEETAPSFVADHTEGFFLTCFLEWLKKTTDEAGEENDDFLGIENLFDDDSLMESTAKHFLSLAESDPDSFYRFVLVYPSITRHRNPELVAQFVSLCFGSNNPQTQLAGINLLELHPNLPGRSAFLHHSFSHPLLRRRIRMLEA